MEAVVLHLARKPQAGDRIEGTLAARLKPRGWRYVHLSAMLLSAYNLFGGAVNEAFLRVAPLRALAGDSVLASPLVGMTHRIVTLVFVILIGSYVAASKLSEATGTQTSSVSP